VQRLCFLGDPERPEWAQFVRRMMHRMAPFAPSPRPGFVARIVDWDPVTLDPVLPECHLHKYLFKALLLVSGGLHDEGVAVPAVTRDLHKFHVSLVGHMVVKMLFFLAWLRHG